MAENDELLVRQEGLKVAYDRLMMESQKWQFYPLMDQYPYENFNRPNNGTTITRGTSTNYYSVIIPCKAGDEFLVTGYPGANARVWAFADKNDNILSYSNVTGAEVVDSLIVAPKNATQLVLNTHKDYKKTSSYYCKIDTMGVLKNASFFDSQNATPVLKNPVFLDSLATTPIAFDARSMFCGSTTAITDYFDYPVGYCKTNGVTWTANGDGQQTLNLRIVEKDRISLGGGAVNVGDTLGYILLKTTHRGNIFFLLSGSIYTGSNNGATIRTNTIVIPEQQGDTDLHKVQASILIPFVVGNISAYTGSDTSGEKEKSVWFGTTFYSKDNPQIVEVSFYKPNAFAELMKKYQDNLDADASISETVSNLAETVSQHTSSISSLTYSVANTGTASGLYTSRLLFWGDSLTAGGGTNFPNVCASTLGVAETDIQNCGVGGESANAIACRQGGDTIVIPAGDSNHLINRTYNYTEIKDLFNRQLLFRGNDEDKGAYKVVIDGQECTMTATVTKPVDDSTLKINGYASPDPDVQWTNVPLYGRCCGADFNGRVVVIFVGTNGAFDGSGAQSVASHMAIIDSMIAHIPHKQYLIMGMSKGAMSVNEHDIETTYFSGVSPDDYDQAMLNHYGAKFFPTRKMLVKYGLTVAKITPNAQDTTDINNGIVPKSLHYVNPDTNEVDYTHLNAAGYTALGKMVAAKIKSLGYTY